MIAISVILDHLVTITCLKMCLKMCIKIVSSKSALQLFSLYYYMRNFCDLIGSEQWYFS